MSKMNTIPDERKRKNCNHKHVVTIHDIANNTPMPGRAFCGGEIISWKWNLADKPAARIMLAGNDVHCSKCGAWGRYSVHGGGFVFPPHGYKVDK